MPNEPVPNIPGYTPRVPSITPDVPTNDTPVIYDKNTEGKVSYIDDTTGKTLKNDGLTGVVGGKIKYTTADKIASYEEQGYELVSNDFKDGNEIFAEEGNNFTVHLKHGTTPITPEKPGKPGEPINPNDPDPNGPKYPDGTKDTDLTKTVTRTINFVDNKGNKVAK